MDRALVSFVLDGKKYDCIIQLLDTQEFTVRLEPEMPDKLKNIFNNLNSPTSLQILRQAIYDICFTP